MIILLFFICMHLYAVDTELTLPGINLDYNQVLLQRNNALQELHPNGHFCCNRISRRYDCSPNNPDITRRLFPPEQDIPGVSWENCYVLMRRSGLGHQHLICCLFCSGICMLTPLIIGPCVEPTWSWQLNLTTALMATFFTITGIPTFGCATDKTKEDDETISLRRIQRNQLVPLLELGELDESDPALQTPTYAATEDPYTV